MNKNRNIYLMYCIVFLQGFVFYGPVATLYRQARGMSMYDIFLLGSVFFILMILFEVPWGWFADRFGYKKTLVIANILFFLSKIAFYQAHSFALFLLETILIALAISGLSGCDMALLYSSVKEEESEKVFGRYSAFGTAGFLMASLLSTIIIARSMDAAAFLTLIPYGIAVILTLLLQEVKSTSERRPKITESIKTVLTNKWMLILVLATALIVEVAHSVSIFLNQGQYLKSGIQIYYFGILMAGMQIIAMGAAKSYRISNKYGKNRTLKILFLSVTIGCFFLVYTSNALGSIACIAVISGAAALVGPMVMEVENKSIKSEDRATILSLYAMSGDIVAAIANLFIGKAADRSIETAFIVCGSIAAVGVLLLFIYFAKESIYE